MTIYSTIREEMTIYSNKDLWARTVCSIDLIMEILLTKPKWRNKQPSHQFSFSY